MVSNFPMLLFLITMVCFDYYPMESIGLEISRPKSIKDGGNKLVNSFSRHKNSR